MTSFERSTSGWFLWYSERAATTVTSAESEAVVWYTVYKDEFNSVALYLKGRFTWITPPPTPEVFKKDSSRPSNFADQSVTIASNSVHAGLEDHWIGSYSWSRYHRSRIMRPLESERSFKAKKKLNLTLKPGLLTLLAYKSARMPSKVHAVGK